MNEKNLNSLQPNGLSSAHAAEAATSEGAPGERQTADCQVQETRAAEAQIVEPQTVEAKTLEDYTMEGRAFAAQAAAVQPMESHAGGEPLPHAKPKKRKLGRMGFAAGLAAVCMGGSAALGFGGACLALILNTAIPLSAESVSGSNGTVLFQSVVRTSANDASDKMSVEDVVANVRSSVVEITTETVASNSRMGQYVSTGAGSGVIISADGYIVTNNHVVTDAQAITIRLSDASEYQAVLVGTDAKTDLAVLKIEANNLQAAILGTSSELLVGQSAIAIGNPLGELGGTVTSGIISALDREISIDGETMSLLQTDTAINPGNSGGGLFNQHGELVGIINAKSSGSEIEGLGFAIPIDTAKTVVEQIIAHGYVKGRIDTGLILVDIQDAHAAMSYRTNQMGLYIAKSGDKNFQSGDRITAVDGNEVSGLADFNQHISTYGVGDKITLTIIRDGKSVSYPLILTELKS